ncbi:MAG: rhomboid family intramembrane serine protease [Acidimicrobiales bacterium]
MAEDLDRPRGLDLIAPVIPVCVIVALMWVEEIIDTGLGGDLDRYGIVPREVSGLDGILWFPFLHGGFGHLIANTLPFLLLGSVIALGSVQRFAYVTVVTTLVCGIGTWLTGPAHTVHIGSSGIVFGYVTYLLSRGVFARHLGYLLGGVLVFFVYGGALWGLLPRPGVSWQGHLFGALGGILAAWLLHSRKELDA